MRYLVEMCTLHGPTRERARQVYRIRGVRA